jgi:hypothetical protein
MGIDSSNKIDILSSTPINFDKAKFEATPAFGNTLANGGLANIHELDTPVLGRITGEFGILDGTSTNKRFYSSHFWNTVIARPEVKKALELGRYLGIFEHPNVKLNYDENGHATARHPKNAGFVTKALWIDGNILNGEAYILNTPLGRLLATYFLARDKYDKPLIQLFISARGYSKNDYIDKTTGLDMMTPDDYLLNGFDVVLTPGLTHNSVKFESNLSDLEKFEGQEELLTYMKIYEDEIVRQMLRDEWNLQSV